MNRGPDREEEGRMLMTNCAVSSVQRGRQASPLLEVEPMWCFCPCSKCISFVFFKYMVTRECSVEKKLRSELFYFCICASLTDIIRDSPDNLRLLENDRERFMATHGGAKARGLMPMGPFCPIGCPSSHPPLLPWVSKHSCSLLHALQLIDSFTHSFNALWMLLSRLNWSGSYSKFQI